MQKFKVIRKITQEECPWLERGFEIGEIVYEYFGCTYGCISHSGIAISYFPDEDPCFEFPLDAIQEIEN